MKINHYVITRFNIYSDDYFNGDMERFHSWSKERLLIFINSTFKSVSNAYKNSSFKWIILFDENSCKEILNFIECELVAKDFIVPIFVAHGLGFSKGAVECSKKFISEDILKNKCDRILTTRIDNDDYIHKIYFKVVKKDAYMYSDHYKILILNYNKGLSYNGDEITEFIMKVPNMFVSLLEIPESFNTVIAYNHSKISDKIPIKNIPNNIPLWMINIHGGNWVNTHKCTNKIMDYNRVKIDFCLPDT